MSIQLALCFDEVPVTCEIQQRYHSIAPCLTGKQSAEEQGDALGSLTARGWVANCEMVYHKPYKIVGAGITHLIC